jgi:molecular chaperone GrpE
MGKHSARHNESEGEKPAPSAGKPAPSADKPAPSAGKPAPSADRPAPSAGKPAPSADRPAPSADRSAPSADKPAPSAGKPAESAPPNEEAQATPVQAEEARALQPEAAPEAAAEEPVIEPLTPERDELWDRFLRMAAEYENRRKRLEQETERRIRYAAHELLLDLLPAVNDLWRALRPQQKKALDEWLAGIELIERRLQDVLAKHRVRPILSIGQKFDPARHEAVSTIETAEKPDSTVVEEVEQGWMLEDRVVVAAKVIVAVAPKPNPAAAQE